MLYFTTVPGAHAAAEAVEDVFRTYANGQTIVSQGATIDGVQLEAIQTLGLLAPEPGTMRGLPKRTSVA